MKAFRKLLSVLLAISMVMGSVAIIATSAFAAEPETHSLKTLADEGKLKLLGRTVAGNSGLATDFSGTGFEMNLTADGGDFTLTCDTNYSDNRYVVFAEGETVLGRVPMNNTTLTATVQLSAGEHTVSVFVDTALDKEKESYFNMVSVTFAGSVDDRPDDKPLYVEFIGDSYACGSGALGTYEPGADRWGNDGIDSAMGGWAYKTAQKLGADYSIVARGGIGLTAGASDAQEQDSKVTIQRLYPYTSYRFQADAAAAEWDFASERKPNMILICIGANDSVGSTAKVTTWSEEAQSFIEDLREKNGKDVPIVWMTANSMSSSKGAQYWAIRNLFDATVNPEAPLADDENLYAFRVNQMLNGEAALPTQLGGHPSDYDADNWADQVVAYLEGEKLVNVPADHTFDNLLKTYYISETGDDANDGSSETPVLTVGKACTLARSDYNGKTVNGYVRFVLSGTVDEGAARENQYFAMANTIKNAAGEKILILVESAEGERATLKFGYTKSSEAGNALETFANDFYFRGVNLVSLKGKANGTTQVVWSACRVFANGCNLTFDDVTFDFEDAEFTKNTNKKMELSASYSRWHDELYGTNTAAPAVPNSVLTLKNGYYDDAHNIEYVTGAATGGSYRSADRVTYQDFSNQEVKVVIGEGAVVDEMYGATTAAGSTGTPKFKLNKITIELAHGGRFNGLYMGTNHESSTRYKYNIKEINFVVSGGTLYGNYLGLGQADTWNGDVNFTMTAGEMLTNPALGLKSNAYQGFMLAGYNDGIINGNVNNTISGGQMTFQGVSGVSVACWFMGRNSVTVNGDVNNTISGGTFAAYFAKGQTSCGGTTGVLFGPLGGQINGDMNNTVTGGLFDTVPTGNGIINFADQSVNFGVSGTQVNTIGVRDAEENRGPTFCMPDSEYVKMAGWGKFGETDYQNKSFPTELSDTVRIKNTIYGGVFQSRLLLGQLETASDSNRTVTADGYWPYCNGSIESTIYGGMFQNTLYCGGGNVWGDVTTTIYGGIFADVYAGSGVASAKNNDKSYAACIHGDVNLTINGFKDYSPTATKPYSLYFGASTANIEGDVNATINGGTFTSAVYAKSANGVTSGEFNVTLNGGWFKTSYDGAGANTFYRVEGENDTEETTMFFGATKETRKSVGELRFAGCTVSLGSTFGIRYLIAKDSLETLRTFFGEDNVRLDVRALPIGSTEEEETEPLFTTQYKEIKLSELEEYNAKYWGYLVPGISTKDIDKEVVARVKVYDSFIDVWPYSVKDAMNSLIEDVKDPSDPDYPKEEAQTEMAKSILDMGQQAQRYFDASGTPREMEDGEYYFVDTVGEEQLEESKIKGVGTDVHSQKFSGVTETAEIVGTNLVLEDEIAIQFWVELKGEKNPTSLHALYRFVDEKGQPIRDEDGNTVTFKDAYVDGVRLVKNGSYYTIKIPCAANRMQYRVQICLCKAGMNDGKVDTTQLCSNLYMDSVASYCYSAIDLGAEEVKQGAPGGTYAKLMPLAKRILNYIYYANEFFKA